MLRMMALDRALLRGAARGGVQRPGGSAQGSVEQDDRNQTQHREKRTKAILRPRVHEAPKLPP